MTTADIPAAAPGAAEAVDPAAPEWYAALTLPERAALAGAAAASGDPELARRRMDAWRRQAPFDDAALLERRAAADGLDLAAFEAALGIPDTALRDASPEPPAWLATLERVLREDPPLPPGGVAVPPGLLEVLAPLLHDAQARLHSRAAALAAEFPGAPFTAAQAPGFFARGLLTHAAQIVGRALTLELHVARMLGVLQGDTPEARFLSFVERIRQPRHRLAFLSEYAAASRLVVEMADAWVDAAAELLRRLCDDAALLDATLGGGRPLGALAAVDGFGVGDPHRGGRSVALLRFATGTRVVYKPRSLAVDAAFHGLLEWLNELGAAPRFRGFATLDRGTHGWAEFVDAAPCRSMDEVERYYERLGGLLAVLHVLDAQDMHMENLVAAGEHPVLVDLETLCHPPLDELVAAGGGPGAREAASLAPEPHGWLARSVLKTALLPQRVWDGDGVGVDLSGVGGAGSQVSPTRAVGVENAGTDEMRVARVQVELPGSHNLPQVTAAEVTPADYTAALDRGFARVYRLLATNRHRLVEGDPRVEAFRDAPLRVVVRMTQVYGLLLRESMHPDFLRDGLDRDRFFDKLWLAVAVKPGLGPVVPHEHAALLRGDVPVFAATAGSRELVTDTGVAIPGFFTRSGMERLAERAAGLGEDDLARQRWLVRASMATLSEDPYALTPGAGDECAADRIPFGGDEGAEAETLVGLAGGIADRLEALALRGPRFTSWLTLTTRTGRYSSATLARYDLHGGVPGILVFLDALAEATGNDRHADTARGAFALLAELLHDGDVQISEPGAFNGLGGVMHALGIAERRWPDLPARFLAERTAARIAALVESSPACNLFGGLAGAAAGLVGHHAATGAGASLEVALRCGRRLLALARPAEGAPAWETPGAPAGPGFLLGRAGVAWALLRLGAAAGEDEFRAVALEALEREWGDWKTEPGPSGVARGAAGMALALLAACETDGGAWRAPLAEAAALADASALSAGHALCTGAAGTLDALLQVAPALPGLGVEARIAAGTRALLDDARARGWRCAAPLGVETPGLLNGLAGIGHGLLRLARPGEVASPLTLGIHAAAAREGA